MALDKLGKELGVALFLGEDAHRRSARLTEAGRLLLQDARTLLDQAEVTAAHMRQFSQRDWAEVRLAHTAALAERTVPALLHDFLTGRGKGCTIYSDEMPTDRIAAGGCAGADSFRLAAALPADAAGRQRSLRQPRRAERRAADYLPPGLPDGQAAGRAVCRLGLHPAPGLSPQPPAPCRPWCWSERKSGKRTNLGRLWFAATAGRDLFLFCFSPPRSHRPGPC